MHLQISCKCNTCSIEWAQYKALLCNLNKQHISRFRELSMVFFCFYFGVFLFENLKIHQRCKKKSLSCKGKSTQLYNFDFTLKDIYINSCIFFSFNNSRFVFCSELIF